MKPELKFPREGVSVSYACNLMIPFGYYESIQAERANVLGASSSSFYMFPSSWPEARCLKESIIQQILAVRQQSDQDLQEPDRHTSPKHIKHASR